MLCLAKTMMKPLVQSVYANNETIKGKKLTLKAELKQGMSFFTWN
jgi:hypothetical protein